MRGYMSVPSSPYFTLEKKIQRLLEVNFAIYNIPMQERIETMDYLSKMDIRSVAYQMLRGLSQAIAQKFTAGITPGA